MCTSDSSTLTLRCRRSVQDVRCEELRVIESNNEGFAREFDVSFLKWEYESVMEGRSKIEEAEKPLESHPMSSMLGDH